MQKDLLKKYDIVYAPNRFTHSRIDTIVVSGLQVIEAGVRIEVVSAIAERDVQIIRVVEI